MPTLEEMTAWSTHEIRAQAEAILPSGWSLTYREDPDSVQSFICEAKSETGTVVKVTAQPDQRVSAFDMYFWLFTRSIPNQRPASNWTRRQDPRLHPITGRRSVSGSPEPPDPEDLDPVAIRDMISNKR